MVVNAPQSNMLSAAEHTMALLLAQARNVPQAHAALVDGRWERSKWKGVELSDKTLGIIGLGRIGKLVAQRALAFGMRLVAYDPFVSPDRARQMSVELRRPRRARRSSPTSSRSTWPRRPRPIGLIGKELLAKAKPGIRIINVARGGIVDEEALAEAIRAGHVGGAALDVFASEPTTESPLFGLDGVVVTPHLGASTLEAQDKAGDTIAEQVRLALAGEFVPFAVNVERGRGVRDGAAVPAAGRAARASSSPRSPTGSPDTLEIEYQGQLADYDTRILTLSVLKGLFGRVTDEPVSYVNAPQIAAERGIEVRDTSTATVARLRQPDHHPRRRARHRRHARRAAGRAPAS